MQILPANDAAWEVAREIVARGGLIAFPTDTVYGVGCDPHHESAILRIFSLKGRGPQKAIPLLLAGVHAIPVAAASVPPAARLLGEQFWPGALTLVVPRRHDLPDALGGGATIGIRVPDHYGLRGLIEACGGALAATSANISGAPDSLDAAQVADYFGDGVELIVDGGPVTGGVPSTVVDCTKQPPVILRQGALPEADIRLALQSLGAEPWK